MDEMLPLAMRSSEPSLATQIEPSLLARTPDAPSFAKPSDDEKVVTLGSRKLSIPFDVPAHSIPSRSSKRRFTESLDSPSVRP